MITICVTPATVIAAGIFTYYVQRDNAREIKDGLKEIKDDLKEHRNKMDQTIEELRSELGKVDRAETRLSVKITGNQEGLSRIEASMKDEFARAETSMKDDFARIDRSVNDEFARVDRSMKEEFARVQKDTEQITGIRIAIARMETSLALLAKGRDESSRSATTGS